MIISHRHKFIFIKTRKTAGTSLEIALGDYCGSKDIVTRISLKDEKVRRKMGKKGAQNYRLPFQRYSLSDWKKLMTKGRFKSFENHDPADKILEFIPKAEWDEYFKFCFERNPWDKMVSHYYWKKDVYNLQNFQEYLDRGMNGEITGFNETLNTRDQYSLDGKVAVDKIYKFEELDDALLDISERLKLNPRLEMPKYKAKGAHRQENRHYRDLLNQSQADWIAEKFSPEIQLLNYSY